MLNTNYIYNFLDSNQILIGNNHYRQINEFEKNNSIILDINQLNLPESFGIFFNKNILDFYYKKYDNKNRSPIFTFFSSIISITDESFNLNNEDEKCLIIKELIKKIDNDLFEKDLYNKFNYNKNRRFNKADIQEIIKNGLQFKYSDKFNLMKEYLADYLGINIYIFNCANFANTEKYLTKYYNNQINKFVPHFILMYENEIYKPILMNKNKNSNSSILTYTNNMEVIDNIWNYFNIKIEENINPIKDLLEDPIEDPIEDPLEVLIEDPLESPLEVPIESPLESPLEVPIEDALLNKTKPLYTLHNLKKMKIDEIKKLCNDNNINLLKKSDKTSNMINKLKDDLIEEILQIY